MTESANNKVEKKPNPNDVLLGRASHIYNHPGNIRYRSIINLNQSKYHACQTRLDKMIFIRQITKDILDDGMVKFWKLNKKNGGWTEVDFRTVQDKVSHALRDGKSTNSGNPDVIPPDDFPRESSTEPTTKPVVESTLLSQIDQLVRSRSRPRLEDLQDMRRHSSSLVEDPRDLAFQERQRSLRLASMAAIGGNRQDLAHLGLHQPRGMQSSQFFSPSSLLRAEASRRTSDSIINDSLINQPNTLSQQLTADDLYLHAMRHRSSFSGAPSASVASLDGHHHGAASVPYRNERVYANSLQRKTLSPPTIGHHGSSRSLREQSLIDTLQKLKSQRVAEIQALEEQLRNVQH